jgi:SAM-dependent methyltransferase
MPEEPPNQFTDVSEFYDSLMSVVPYRWWVLYVINLWSRFDCRPHRVLDLACGTGNVLKELLEHGYEAEGVDLSEGMLRVARRKLPAGTPLWRQDARFLNLPTAPYDACVCLFDSLNYITELDGLRRAFRGVRGHLIEGGTFVFDMNAIRALEKGMFNQSGTGKDASLEYEWESAWEPATRLCAIRMEFRVHDDGGTRVFHETHVQRGYTVAEIRGALHDEGFEVLGFFDAFSTKLPTEKTDRYHVIVRAPVMSP